MYDGKLLKHSREYFVRHGGARGELIVGNRVCAIGAVRMAGGEEILGKDLLPDFVYLADTPRVWAAVSALSEMSDAVYELDSIAQINDVLGYDAVLHVFDLCIKDCEATEAA